MRAKKEMIWYEVDGEVIVKNSTNDANLIWKKLHEQFDNDFIHANRLYRSYMGMTNEQIHKSIECIKNSFG